MSKLTDCVNCAEIVEDDHKAWFKNVYVNKKAFQYDAYLPLLWFWERYGAGRGR